MRNSSQRRRSGFTLAELMVVIVIIAVLATLVAPAAFVVIKRAKEAKISLEIGAMASALQKYVNENHGTYPPSLSDPDAVSRHLRKKFPHSRDRVSSGIDAAEALVFWLHGFSSDSEFPLSGPGGPADRSGQFSELSADALFDFDKTRLVDQDEDGYPEYLPPNDLTTPYVLFVHSHYEEESYPSGGNSGGSIKPYLSALPSVVFAADDTYQIISAGLDDRFGTGGGTYPTGEGYDDDDMDNITSFAGGSLERKLP